MLLRNPPFSCSGSCRKSNDCFSTVQVDVSVVTRSAVIKHTAAVLPQTLTACLNHAHLDASCEAPRQQGKLRYQYLPSWNGELLACRGDNSKISSLQTHATAHICIGDLNFPSDAVALGMPAAPLESTRNLFNWIVAQKFSKVGQIVFLEV